MKQLFSPISQYFTECQPSGLMAEDVGSGGQLMYFYNLSDLAMKITVEPRGFRPFVGSRGTTWLRSESMHV